MSRRFTVTGAGSTLALNVYSEPSTPAAVKRGACRRNNATRKVFYVSTERQVYTVPSAYLSSTKPRRGDARKHSQIWSQTHLGG